MEARIDRVLRLVRMLEQDEPLVEMRVSELTSEYQQSTKDYAARLTARARAELVQLMLERLSSEAGDSIPHAAD
jgi:hypothetical protein